MRRYRPVVLGVLDGWGIAPAGAANAVTRARTSRLGALFAAGPHAALDASGRAVGLPDGLMGNSEVGHLTMGAGYIHYQDLVRVNDAMADGSFFQNAALRSACAAAATGRGTLHLMGLLSTGGVHADLAHLDALVTLAEREKVTKVVFHAFLDGRDMAPRSALGLLPRVRAPIATVHGRFYAMDRDTRWERTERSWRAIVDGEGPTARSAVDAIRACYDGEACRDELLEPVVVGAGAPVRDGDGVIFFNFRPDRARQLTRAFRAVDFEGFARERVPDVTFVTLTDYHAGVPAQVAFPQTPATPLAAVLRDHGLRQFRTAETEKYAHVTYFFNGGIETAFAGEDRLVVPSQRVATYDLAPAMSAAGVADALIAATASGKYDFAVFNLANPDMVGHTGDIDAALLALEATDLAVGRIVDAIIAAGGCLLLTSDHGNCEEMAFPDGGANTQHTTNQVPVVFAARDADRWSIRDGGLVDCAPTILMLLDLPVPEWMTGGTLLTERS